MQYKLLPHIKIKFSTNLSQILTDFISLYTIAYNDMAQTAELGSFRQDLWCAKSEKFKCKNGRRCALRCGLSAQRDANMKFRGNVMKFFQYEGSCVFNFVILLNHVRWKVAKNFTKIVFCSFVMFSHFCYHVKSKSVDLILSQSLKGWPAYRMH